MRFEETLAACSDLSSMWFKEFSLELAKEVQFPIEMSLPWILTRTAIQTSWMGDYIAVGLDLYNDSASHALNVLGARHLFEEIEAEVNLCFDQLVFEVSQTVFTSFKARGTAVMMDKEARKSMPGFEGAKLQHKLDAPLSGAIGLLRQRRLQVLGRSVDVHLLVTESINAIMRKTLDSVISQFEAEDITHVVVLEAMLESSRKTHALLSEHLTLDPFDAMLSERNQSMNPCVCPRCRSPVPRPFLLAVVRPPMSALTAVPPTDVRCGWCSGSPVPARAAPLTTAAWSTRSSSSCCSTSSPISATAPARHGSPAHQSPLRSRWSDRRLQRPR